MDLSDSGLGDEFGHSLFRLLQGVLEPERCFLEEDVMSSYIVKVLDNNGPMELGEACELTLSEMRAEFPDNHLSMEYPLVRQYFLGRLGFLRNRFSMVERDGDGFSLTPAGKSIWDYYGQKVMEYHRKSDRRTYMM